MTAVVSKTRAGHVSGGQEPLRIGGIQKHSLIDYPGKLSCVLFLTGCNLECPYCHNPALARGEAPSGSQLPDLNTFLEFLQRRSGLLEGVVVSGGEPTLQAGLFDLCRQVRLLGYPIKLDTNGSRPEILRCLIERGLVDYIAMDVKTRPSAYRRYLGRGCDPAPFLDSIRLILSSGIDHEFRTTCLRPIVDPGTIEEISRLIAGARRFVLQRFRHTTVLHPEFFQTGKTANFTGEELEHLRAIAAARVGCCRIR